MLALIARAADPGDEEEAAPGEAGTLFGAAEVTGADVFAAIRDEPGNVSVKTIGQETFKLGAIRAAGLPDDLFATSAKSPKCRSTGRSGPSMATTCMADSDGTFSTRDGHRIMIVALTLRQWQALCEATGLAEGLVAVEHLLGVDLGKEGDRFIAREQIGALLKPWVLQTHRVEEARASFDQHGVSGGPIRPSGSSWSMHPRCSTANPMWPRSSSQESARTSCPAHPVTLSDLPRTPPRPALLLGGSTPDASRPRSSGLSALEIGKLHDARHRRGTRTAATSPQALALIHARLGRRPPPCARADGQACGCRGMAADRTVSRAAYLCAQLHTHSCSDPRTLT